MEINNKTLGLQKSGDNFINSLTEKPLLEYIDLKLAFLGCPTVGMARDPRFKEMLDALLQSRREAARHQGNYYCPVDRRIQNFLQDYLQEDAGKIALPNLSFVLDRHGLARELSLPRGQDEFASDIVHSYRVEQGVLHNPKADRRTTKGVFHIAEGGSPIPDDKIGVPKKVFARLLEEALAPPKELLRLPLTVAQEEQAHCWVSLLLRPLVCPRVPGIVDEKTMEIRFFAPGTLVSNLDFVESIFGNAGDPYLPENDAGLDFENWSGHTGCVILAPHLIHLSKKELGLPHYDDATPRQREDGMCWRDETEKYNDGKAFKVACRDERGVMVTLIADNYFGYCKKEVKTQISYAANLSRQSEEEHAGGALVFQAYDLGEEYSGSAHAPRLGHSWPKVLSAYNAIMDVQPEGYGIDKNYPDILYVPEDVHFDLHNQMVSWPDKTERGEVRLKLAPNKIYVRPSGYRVQMEKLPGTNDWRLSGTVAEGTLCHKPCTVSGGGKSEISKPISDAIIQGPVFVADFGANFDAVEAIINRDYSDRFSEDYKSRFQNYTDSRPILSPRRSLGSVIKLLTPASRDFTPQYNEWLNSIPQYIKELVFVVKRFYKPQWRGHWREHFSVDIINGVPGNELKFEGHKLIANYLRVGYDENGAWRVFGLRHDFHPAAKLAFEDDITVSAIVETDQLRHLNPNVAKRYPALKFVQNCEYRLFQRPDEAIHRGYDKQTEIDYSHDGNFFSNYEPLPVAVADEFMEDSIGFDKFSEPMQELIEKVATNPSADYFVNTARPRIVDGKPSKNPRYLQLRTDIAHPRDAYLAEMCTRLFRRIPLDEPVHFPVDAVLPGRRNNPPDHAAGVSALAVFNPIHYLELPEAFLEFICSMTGKSPSTTGAGSEGALTKAPFNALLPIRDLNQALLSYIHTGYDIFLTAAGYIGPHVRMDHDISFLVPEVWCRMSERERDPHHLIEGGYLEKCEDFTYEGRLIPTSRLGYRITKRFVKNYFGRIFNLPHLLFTEEMLRPEKQSLELVVEGMDTIVATQKKVAEYYFNDGGIELACPPLRALLHIMRDGHYEGKPLTDPAIRQLFTREQLLSSDWYQQFIAAREAGEKALWQRHEKYFHEFLDDPANGDIVERLNLKTRWEKAGKKNTVA